MKTHAIGTALAVAFAFGLAQPTSAATIAVHSGGIAGLATNTTGTGADAANAWLISETMTSAGTLAFSDRPLGGGNSTGTVHNFGKWFSKTVTNNTGTTWTSFELELQSVLGVPSTSGDGLSFADGSALTGSFTSDQFSTYTRIDTVRDYLNFSGGDVLAGESVTFSFVVTDNAADNFFLLQTPNKRDVRVPLPGTLALFGLGGLAAVALRSRRTIRT